MRTSSPASTRIGPFRVASATTWRKKLRSRSPKPSSTSTASLLEWPGSEARDGVDRGLDRPGGSVRRRRGEKHEPVHTELGECGRQLRSDSSPWRHADLQRAELVGTLEPVGHRPEVTECEGGVVGGVPAAEPAVGPRDGAAISRCTVASDDDRDRVLKGTGVGVDVVEVDEATVVFGCSSYHSAYIASRYSSVTAPRSAKLAPRARNSGSR